VLAAPGKFVQYKSSDEDIDHLMSVARQEFDNVVVDWGSRLDFTGSAVLKESTTIYLVTQAGIPELRNSNRMISQYFSGNNPQLQIVINRYEPRSLGVSEEHITKALTRPAQWKIPNNYAVVRRMQNSATPITQEDSTIARAIRQMTKSVCGPTVSSEPKPEKKRGFSLFG
jgi:Flp pilus assembly CpaE family ATPase